MPASGKSTIGVILAKVIGYDFIDSDLLIQRKEGKRLSEIIEEKGIDGFLAVENEVNASIEASQCVIATGGSAVYGVEAMRHLRTDGIDCTLDVLGNFEERYEQKIRDGEAEGWLRYHGYQKDVRPFIANCHCFVLPSWHEGMANTNLECAAMGRPVITSDIPGCREAVVPGVSGFLCRAGDEESLYEAMKQFLQLPREAREAMGAAGRCHMETNFDKQEIVRKTREALGL
jgi:hypothetical protein